MDLERIRNFSIIAHIDHGKSTLSDRILEVTGAVDARDMREQYLDSMDLERERGITIKAQNVRVDWKGHVFHLIDTPGHVDFGYEVSRSLAACEGVVLVVDAAQGIEAQTLANCYLALEHDLEIVAALNKIDLPAADPDRYADGDRERARHRRRGHPAHLGQDGRGRPRAARRRRSSASRRPSATPTPPLQALIFDSQFDQYRGVVSSVRVINGRLASGARLRFMQAGAQHEADRDRRPPAGADAGRRARARRGRLPHRRHQGRRRGPLRRDGHDRDARRRPRPCPATATRSRWSSPGCSRSTATTSRTSATRWRS